MFFNFFRLNMLFCLIFLVFNLFFYLNKDLVNVVFCDVGQGDATLITHKNIQILVDAGKDTKVLACLEENMPFWDRNIEFAVATHQDADHIGGFLEVFKHYKVEKIMTNWSEKNTDDFKAFKNLLSSKKSNNTQKITSELGQTYQFGKLIDFKVISPLMFGACLEFLAKETSDLNILNTRNKLNGETTLSDKKCQISSQDKGTGLEDDENFRSIVLLLHIGSVKILLMGDADINNELAMIHAGLIEDIDVLKVGHHGSKLSSGVVFLDKIRPELSVISSGKNNNYNHPHPEVIQRLKKINSRVLKTDTLGTITVTSDGVSFWN